MQQLPVDFCANLGGPEVQVRFIEARFRDAELLLQVFHVDRLLCDAPLNRVLSVLQLGEFIVDRVAGVLRVEFGHDLALFDRRARSGEAQQVQFTIGAGTPKTRRRDTRIIARGGGASDAHPVFQIAALCRRSL